MFTFPNNPERAKLFNQTIYDLWNKLELNNDNTIHGRTFSDSVIIYSNDDSTYELDKILKFLTGLYKESLLKCGLPLRGGLSVGEFDDLQAVDFNNLQKGLIIGTLLSMPIYLNLHIILEVRNFFLGKKSV